MGTFMLADNGERSRIENYRSAGIFILETAEQSSIHYRTH